MRVLIRVIAATTLVLATTQLSAQEQVEPQREPDPAPVDLESATWVRASMAFTDGTPRTFIGNQFVDENLASTYGAHAILPYTDDVCPAGWEHLKSEESGEPLFYAFGLMVDAKGHPQSTYVLMPACVKQ